ncbi:MAG: hypothetical protein ACYC6C_02290 [Coriobacteriia bacterium]
MPEGTDKQDLEAVIRGIASAGKALRLYPPTSPIPRQSVESAATALDTFLTEHPALSLTVARQGFTWHGDTIGSGLPGVTDLADMLRDHGVAGIDFVPGCNADELIGFLTVIMQDRSQVLAQGGVGAMLSSAGIDSVRASEVQLTVIEEVGPAVGEDIDEFLRELALDPDKLATWMAAASAGDRTVFAEGLGELAAAVGPEGMERLMETMATAFMKQNPDGKDALLGLALSGGTVRGMTGGMFGNLGDGDIASSLTEGVFAKNMLCLSNALTGLPLEERIAAVKAQVQEQLAMGGHAEKEVSYLDHMVEVRQLDAPEPALAETVGSYRQVVESAELTDDEVASLRAFTDEGREGASAAGVNTILALLDQQQDFELYCKTADSLAALVPRLIESGDLALAHKVLGELSAREGRAVQPWPELSARLRQAITTAVSPQSMAALIGAVISSPEALGQARDIARLAGEAAGPAMIEQAVSLKEEGIAAAEQLVGRRIVDLLAAHLPHAQWFQLAPAVARLAVETDSRSQQAVEVAARRSDEQSRREVAGGLSRAGAGGSRLLAAMTRDASPDVAIAAIRGLAKSTAPDAGGFLAARLDELDVDGKDYALAREVIGALARVQGPSAGEALTRLASRKALIKRGHFAEIQDLAGQALAARAQRGGAR